MLTLLTEVDVVPLQFLPAGVSILLGLWDPRLKPDALCRMSTPRENQIYPVSCTLLHAVLGHEFWKWKAMVRSRYQAVGS